MQCSSGHSGSPVGWRAEWAWEAGLGRGCKAGGGCSPGLTLGLAWAALPVEAVTLLQWNSWVRGRKTDVYWKRLIAADVIVSPAGHCCSQGSSGPSCQGSIPGAAAGAAPPPILPSYPPPKHNYRDAEKISRLKSEGYRWWVGAEQGGQARCGVRSAGWRSSLGGRRAVWSCGPGQGSTHPFCHSISESLAWFLLPVWSRVW